MQLHLQRNLSCVYLYTDHSLSADKTRVNIFVTNAKLSLLVS